MELQNNNQDGCQGRTCKRVRLGAPLSLPGAGLGQLTATRGPDPSVSASGPESLVRFLGSEDHCSHWLSHSFLYEPLI